MRIYLPLKLNKNIFYSWSNWASRKSILSYPVWWLAVLESHTCWYRCCSTVPQLRWGLHHNTFRLPKVRTERHLVQAPGLKQRVVKLHHLHWYGRPKISWVCQRFVCGRLFTLVANVARVIGYFLWISKFTLYSHPHTRTIVSFIDYKLFPVDNVVQVRCGCSRCNQW